MVTKKLYEILSILHGMEPADQDIVVAELIKDYAKQSVNNSSRLLELIPDIAKIQYEQLSKIATDNYQAAEWMCNLGQMTLNKKDNSAYFAAMVPVATVLFKNGTAKGASLAKQKFFDQFIELYKKEFSWDKDGRWAESFGYSDYFRLIDKNIQEGRI